MKLIRTRGRLPALFISLGAFLFDRITKLIVLSSDFASEGSDIAVIPGLFSFSFAWNEGAAFSVLREHPGLLIALTLVILVLIALLVFAPRKEDLLSRLSLSLVLGGGLGNLLDRFLYGAVADFIRFDFINFPIFNCADICVTAGVVLFGMGAFFPHGRKGNE